MDIWNPENSPFLFFGGPLVDIPTSYTGVGIKGAVYGFGGRFSVSQGCRGYPFTRVVATPIFPSSEPTSVRSLLHSVHSSRFSALSDI